MIPIATTIQNLFIERPHPSCALPQFHSTGLASESMFETAQRAPTVTAVLDDALWLAVVVGLFPVGILLIGAPIAACLRVIVEIAHRL